MDIFSELILTISLSLIFASFFIKLASTQPNDTDNDIDNDKLTEEAQMIDKFQYMPFKEEVTKLEDCPKEGKSSVELYSVVGVNKEGCKFQDVEFIDNKEGETEGNDDDDEINARFRSEEENGGENKMCEIEIEAEEDEEEEEIEIGIMDDWEEIGRKDFEELLGNKAGFYNVEVDYEK